MLRAADAFERVTTFAQDRPLRLLEHWQIGTGGDTETIAKASKRHEAREAIAVRRWLACSTA